MACSSLQGQKRKAPAAYLMSSVTVPSVCRSKRPKPSNWWPAYRGCQCCNKFLKVVVLQLDLVIWVWGKGLVWLDLLLVVFILTQLVICQKTYLFVNKPGDPWHFNTIVVQNLFIRIYGCCSKQRQNWSIQYFHPRVSFLWQIAMVDESAKFWNAGSWRRLFGSIHAINPAEHNFNIKNHAVTRIPCDAAHVVLCVVFTHRPSCVCSFVYIAKPPPLILSHWSPFIKVSSVCKVWQRFCFKPMRNWDPFSPLSLVFKKGVTHQPQIKGYNCTKFGENHLLNNKVKVRTK